jgi:hypothetical protein
VFYRTAMKKGGGSLLKFARNTYSQNGEDGVVEELCRRLGIGTNGWFCEFGAWDGKHLSNTFKLVAEGWHGVMIEGHPERFKDLLNTAAESASRIIPINAYVSTSSGDPNSLDALLSTTGIPSDFDILSIDIDSWDWQVWHSLNNYKPKIVIIEINSSILPGIERVHTEDGNGSSFTSTLKLGVQKNYTLVVHTGNLIFVRNDLVSRIGLPASELRNPNSLFIWDWVTLSPLKRLQKRLLATIGLVSSFVA